MDAEDRTRCMVIDQVGFNVLGWFATREEAEAYAEAIRKANPDDPADDVEATCRGDYPGGR